MIVAGITTPLQHVLRPILDWLHGTIHLPWAWSIVALTVIVRMILVPLTVRQIHSMQNMQRYAPEMKALQQKYKGDRQKQNEELMKFYKENHINPAASCLPMLAQFPVFIGLYYTLRAFSKNPPCPVKPESICINRGDFSWLGHGFVPNIADHANAHWSGFVLLAIYALSQMASTYFMGATMDKTQRNLMMVLPVVFLFVVVRFPTGLVLYWMTTNLWTVGQGLITRRLVPKTAASSPFKRSSRTPAKNDAPVPTPKAAMAVAAPPRRVKKKKKSGRR
ncbi:MAG: YidC/Oxa1 family membrane protein insertase [Gaiellaceae bacterium]